MVTKTFRAILTASVMMASTQALALPSPRGAEHADYGRLVFDWPKKVRWNAEINGSNLVIRFEQPVVGDPQTLLKPLGNYISQATVSADRKQITFALSRQVQLKTFERGNSTVIDLKPVKTAAAAEPVPPAAGQAPNPLLNLPVVELPKIQNPAPKPALAAVPVNTASVNAAPVNVTPAPSIMARGGAHPTFHRVVFDWPNPVPFTTAQNGEFITLTFKRPARLNIASVEAALPRDMKFVEVTPSASETAVTFQVPATTRPKVVASGNKVILDLQRNAGPALETKADPAPEPAPIQSQAQAPDTSKEAPRAALGPTPLMPDPAKPRIAETGVMPKPELFTPPPIAAAPRTPAPEIIAASPSSEIIAASPRPEPVAAAPLTPDPVPASPAENEPKSTVSLGVAFDQPSGAAAFKRAGWLWLVFDRKAAIDARLLKRTGGDVVLHAEEVKGVKNGSAVRLIVQSGYNPVLRKEGQMWVFDLVQAPISPKIPFSVRRQFDFEDRGRLILPIADPKQTAVLVPDPEMGDMIHVMPVANAGQGVREEVLVPGAHLLTTAQGVALVPLADGVHIEGMRAGIEVAMPGGLHLSRDAAPLADEELASGQPLNATSSGNQPLNLGRWARGGLDKFVEENQRLYNRTDSIKPEQKSQHRLEIARHYLANAMAAEALAQLRAIEATDPAFAETPEFRAVRGVGYFLTRKYAESAADLSVPSLEKDPQAQVWLAAALARQSGQPAKYALQLRLAFQDLKDMTPRLRLALGHVAVESTTLAGDHRSAEKIIETLGGPELTKSDQGLISYLQGMTAEAAKSTDLAVSHYQDAYQSPNRLARALARLRQIELQLATKGISKAEAIERMHHLRFAWRGDEFEYQLLKRLGSLMLEDEQYAEGLRLLKSVSLNFTQNPDLPAIRQIMSDGYEYLFLNDAAQKLQPIAAIGLFDEFSELVPDGPKGDEMIRKLADRLAGVDLLDRASDLLRHQIKYRLDGLQKAKVGARLAYLELTNRRAVQAFEALNISEVEYLDPLLFDQRRYMRVKAMADLGRAAEALALIVNDTSLEARKLRAEIYWDMKKWPEAAAALESTLGKPDDENFLTQTAPQLVDLATTLTLARDERGLQRIRRTYGAAMAKSPYADAFSLLTSEVERGIMDYRLVNDKIKQAENFRDFMANWRQKVKSDGLSSLN